MVRNLFAAAVVAVLGGVVAAADLKSGPQAGDKVPGAFHPYNVNGENAGKAACLYCAAGDSPVAVVFARTGDDAMTHKLIKALDAETVKNAKADMFRANADMDRRAVFDRRPRRQVEGLARCIVEFDTGRTLPGRDDLALQEIHARRAD